MTLTVGELFAGYGGMHLGVAAALGDTQLVWYADNAPGPSRVMARHHPSVPNLGDVSRRDWSTVYPVDILTGGTPCQDVSQAGRGAGMRAGTRSGLWAAMTDAIAALRPRVVIWENVRGALSAGADSDMEPCSGCVGDGTNVPHLRALGRVLGDLAELGYDAWWTGLRAADVGAPHGRFRVFLIAEPTDTHDTGLARQQGRARAAQARRFVDPLAGANTPALPTPTVDDAGNVTRDSGAYQSLTRAVQLLPTPNAGLGDKHNRDNGTDPARRRALGRQTSTADVAVYELDEEWGPYALAIARWEAATGRLAPDPTMPNRANTRRLSPRFVEWLMGLEAGYVVDTPHLGHRAALEILGNGVVPQQLAAALTEWATS